MPKTPTIVLEKEYNMTDKIKIETFANVYREELIKAIGENPKKYTYSATSVDEVVCRMVRAILNGSFNKTGTAFEATCKRLNIVHTYAAIKEHFTLPEQARNPEIKVDNEHE
jgi:hypothetical protein